MATHSRILGWKIPWTVESGRLTESDLTEHGHEFPLLKVPPPNITTPLHWASTNEFGVLDGKDTFSSWQLFSFF